MLESIPGRAVNLSVLRDRTIMRLKRISSNSTENPTENDARTLPELVSGMAPAEPRTLCLASNELLLVFDVPLGIERRHEIEHQVARENFAVVELSQGVSTVRIEGPAVREVLAKICGLDFRPHRFRPGSCARTRLAQIAVTLECRSLLQFDLYVDRSYFWHLYAWLADVSVEFQAQGA
jgi:heterotetrameric sarcosine oxidase gamma subunit